MIRWCPVFDALGYSLWILPEAGKMVKSLHGNTRKSGSSHHGQLRPAQQGRQQGRNPHGQVRKGAGKAFKAVGTAAKGLAIGAGAALAGLAIAGIKAFVSLGDSLDKMSKRTGFSVEALGELKFAAEQSGASSGDNREGHQADGLHGL